MQPRKPLILILALAALAQPAAAWDGVEVTDSTGTLRKDIQAAPSPTPGYCYWDSDPTAGPSFSATNADGYGNTGCTSPWFVHCDGDSLVYRGTWPFIESNYITSSQYRVALSCSVTITTETRLTASRSAVGELDVDEHALTLVYKDGTSLPILQAGSGPDEAQLVLPPGSYLITLHVHAVEYKVGLSDLHPYEGSILLKWEDPAGVATEPMSWSSLKTLFR